MYRPEPRRLRPVSQLHSQSSSCQCHRQRARRVTCKSHGDRAAVKLGEREAIEGLVEVRLLVPQDADRDRFAEHKSLHGIRAPMDGLEVTAQSRTVGELSQLAR